MGTALVKTRFSDLIGVKAVKLTTASFELILDALSKGNHIDVAAALAGITPEAMQRYLQRGSQEYNTVLQQIEEGVLEENEVILSIYAELYLAVINAEAKGQNDLVTIIRNESASNWSAAAYLLERRYGKNWAKQSTSTSREVEEKRVVKTLIAPTQKASSDKEFMALVQKAQMTEETVTKKYTETTTT